MCESVLQGSIWNRDGIRRALLGCFMPTDELNRINTIDDRRESPYISLRMIFSALSNADSCFSEDWWRDTLAYIRAATPSLEDGVHQVRGDTIVARIHQGHTRPPSDAVLESHRAHVDVHVVLEGRETIAVWPADRLRVRTPYNDQQDVTFYDLPSEEGARLCLSPGFFAVFFPQDAHMTQLMDRQPVAIKKLVMKISVELAGNSPRAR